MIDCSTSGFTSINSIGVCVKLVGVTSDSSTPTGNSRNTCSASPIGYRSTPNFAPIGGITIGIKLVGMAR